MPTDLETIVERIPLDELTPYPNNPRKGDLDTIRESLTEHGQQEPLVVSSDGVILAGNHRWQVMRELGWPVAKIIRATHPDGRPVHSTDDRAAAYVAIDNRSSDLADNDPALLAELLTALPSLAGTGYVQDDLSDLLIALESLPEAPALTSLPEPEQGSPDHTGKNKLGDDGSMKEWAASARRIVLFDLPVPQFVWAQDQMQKLCTELDLPSNAALFMHLLATASNTEAPAGMIPDEEVDPDE